jgi:caspase domain-containing protein
MAPVKRALLIGSSYDGLPGTENDVNAMAGILVKYGFQSDDIKRLCGEEATRQKILDSWQKIISESKVGDSVVFYYSGHGGLAEKKELEELNQLSLEDKTPNLTQEEPKRIQFLIPVDYDPKLEHWKGIFDSEISKFLFDTTRATPNVTYILDCCHSARLGRKPLANHAIPKALSTSDYDLTLEKLKQLRQEKKLLENEGWSNPNVVRIAASADRESAWQYQNAAGKHVGILTEKLALVIGKDVVRSSWRNIMAGVGALVDREFAEDQKAQQPRSAGADTRMPFSMEVDWSRALVAEMAKKAVLIHGGRVHGISEGDAFTLTPLISERATSTAEVIEASTQVTTVVNEVSGFHAQASPVPRKDFPYKWSLARPLSRKRRWPVRFPEKLTQIQDLVEKSGDLETCKQDDKPLLEFRDTKSQDGEFLTLRARGVQIGSTELESNLDVEKLFSTASMFAQAQNLLFFEKGTGDEYLGPDLKIEIGVVKNSKEEERATYVTR